MKLFFRVLFLISTVYITFWSYNNIDFISIFKDGINLVKYEFNMENLQTSIDSFMVILKKQM